MRDSNTLPEHGENSVSESFGGRHGGHRCTAGAHHDDPEAEELLALWAALDDAQRANLLAVARGLASGKAQGVKTSG